MWTLARKMPHPRFLVGSIRPGRLGAVAIALPLIVAAAVLAPARPAEAAAFTVNSQKDAVDANPGDGVCATASLPNEGVRCTLRAAIMETNALAGADTINLPMGTYTLGYALAGLSITDSLAIIGGDALTTIIEAETPSSFNTCGGSVIAITNAEVAMSGVTIRNGGASTGPSCFLTSLRGGGILLTSGGLRLTNVVVQGNHATEGGGVFAQAGTTMTLAHVALVGNGAYRRGGGLVNLGTAELAGVRVVSNGTGGGPVGTGGGDGGGIVNAGNGVLSLVQSTVSGNGTAGAQQSYGGRGGGLANLDSGDVTITLSLISGNYGYLEGGGIYQAGALGVADPRLTLVNVSLTGNTSAASIVKPGSAISIAAGSVTVTNSTIAGNLSTATAGQSILNSGSGTVTFKNSIVSSAMDAPLCSGNIVSLGHNLETGTTCGFTAAGDLRRTDPMIANLADNGGPTQTHKLLPGSPAIDAGDNAGCPQTDQRAGARPRDGDGDGSAICDIGAFELQPYDAVLSCTPRPTIGLQTARIGPGQIRGVLAVTRTESLPTNALTQIQVTRLDNVAITVNGLAATAGQTIPLPPGTTQAHVIVTRAGPGAFTARIVVTDGCGAWPTFLGGGAGVL